MVSVSDRITGLRAIGQENSNHGATSQKPLQVGKLASTVRDVLDGIPIENVPFPVELFRWSPILMAQRPNSGEKWPSYTMVEPRMRKIYFQFYQQTYRSSQLDRKTKELIAIAASLATHCSGCLEGHIKKALKYGASKEEISETVAITMGVAAASIVDLTDIAAENLQIRHFDETRAPEEPRDVSPEE